MDYGIKVISDSGKEHSIIMSDDKINRYIAVIAYKIDSVCSRGFTPKHISLDVTAYEALMLYLGKESNGQQFSFAYIDHFMGVTIILNIMQKIPVVVLLDPIKEWERSWY